MPPEPPDPVLVRRARWASVARWGQRTGYLAILAAMVIFGVGIVGRFTDTIATLVIAALALATVTLAPGIVIGYAVRAAERDELRQ